MLKPQGHKVILSSLNSKYIHSTLALRYLREFSKNRTAFQIDIAEYTINQSAQDVIAAIYQRQPDVLGFSCYIWNIESTLRICRDYKQVAPHVIIVLGGPEVSYDAEEVLKENPFIDYVIRGEGEETFHELLLSWQNDHDLNQIDGLSYTCGNNVVSNPDRELNHDLDQLPFPYQDEEDILDDRVKYYESSRGCPFHCSYCLSSVSHGVRYFSLARVKSDLAKLLSSPAREIKFVDRTFNVDESRTMEIMQFIISQGSLSKVHFEIDAGLISDSLLEFLSTVPPGLFNFEIGIQSTYPPALKAVRRHMNWERIAHNIKSLRAIGNIHLHVDLIAGLPYEDLESFRQSFDMVYGLQAHYLQLGFLKLLKGSPLRQAAKSFGYRYQSHPPYQVLSSSALTFAELLTLSRIEQLLDWYYNSNNVPVTLAYLIERAYSGQAMKFYQELAEYFQAHSLFGIAHKQETLYTYLFLFIASKYPEYILVSGELLKYDYLRKNHQYTLPDGLVSYNPDNIHHLTYALADDQEFIAQHLLTFKGQSARQIKKQINLEYFRINPLDPRQPGPVWLMFVYDRRTKVAQQIVQLEFENQAPAAK